MLDGKPLWINAASGTDLKPWPWRNLDIVARWPGTARGCDIVWDARKDRIPFPDGTADQIYAGYLLLHLAPRYHEFVLSEIHRVLAPDTGVAVFGEVAMEVLLPRWLQNPEDKYLSGLVWGEQGIEFGEEYADADKHCQGFTEVSLRKVLAAHGFKDITRIKIHVDAVFYELTLRCVK